MITQKNIELYLFRYKEGLLNDEEAGAVRKALEAHPEWKAMADAYDPALRLPKAAPLPYPGKERLHKLATDATASGNSKSRRVVPLWTRVAAAACLIMAFALGLRLLWPSGEAETPVIVADNAAEKTPEADVSEKEVQPVVAPELPMVYRREPMLIAEADAAPAELPTEDAATVEKSVVETDRLIVYLDENENEESTQPVASVMHTDRLIVYFEDEAPEAVESEPQKPDWMYAYQDLRNSVQLRYTERRTEVIGNLLAMREK